MAIASAILIAVYIISIILVMKWPTRQHHPEDAQAVGCLSFIVALLLLLGAILGIGVWLRSRVIVDVVFAVTLFPAVIAAPQLAWHGIKKLQKTAVEKGKRIPA